MKIWYKKNDILDFWNTPSVIFFVVAFLTKKRPILTALKQMILDEIKQSNGIKPQKIYFFMSSSQRNFLLEIAFTKYFYLLPETSKISLLRTDLPPFI